MCKICSTKRNVFWEIILNNLLKYNFFLVLYRVFYPKKYHFSIGKSQIFHYPILSDNNLIYKIIFFSLIYFSSFGVRIKSVITPCNVLISEAESGNRVKILRKLWLMRSRLSINRK